MKQMRGRRAGYGRHCGRHAGQKLGRRCCLLGKCIPVVFERQRRLFSKRESPIHNVGLFAEQNFKVGEVLGYFTGQQLSRREATERRQVAAKSIVEYVGLEGRIYLDASRGQAPFQWINSVAGSGVAPNVRFVVIGDRLCIETCAAVNAGGELLADYAL